MVIEQQVWGFTPKGEGIILYTLKNSSGAYVQVTNVGASLVSVVVPDKNGKLEDVVLGYKDPMSYFHDGPAMGKTVGRFANRIANGVFSLNGTEYRLAQNNGRNHLHGGVDGFANKLWEASFEGDNVVMQLVSADGDQGYPAEMHAEVVYSWSEDNCLTIRLLAKTSAPTIVNLTNHAYFNLKGESAGAAEEQTLELNADTYLLTDAGLIPTGELADVEGTPLDFRTPTIIGTRIDDDFEALHHGCGYDLCYAVNGWSNGKMCYAGTLSDPSSGRKMRVESTQPGIQIYSANFLQGAAAGKNGKPYLNRDGIAMECQGFPDAPNKPQFPSPVLNPDQMYDQTIAYKFISA